MKHNKKKILIILDELMMLFLRLGCKHIQTSVSLENEKSIICIEGYYDKKHKDELAKLEDILTGGRCIETEEYYWSISGVGELNQGSELYVISSMLDECMVFHDDEFLKITATRND